MCGFIPLVLSDEETAALLAELDRIIDSNRFPLLRCSPNSTASSIATGSRCRRALAELAEAHDRADHYPLSPRARRAG
jgi:hypothetical protein